MRVRARLVVTLLSLTIVIIAGLCQLTGHADATLSLLVLWVLITVAVEPIEHFRPRPTAPLPDISSDVTEQLRQQRDEAGIVTAVRRLKKMYPEISLQQAAQLVRDL